MNTRSVFPYSNDREWLPEQRALWRDLVYIEPTMLRHYDSQQSFLIHGTRGSGLTTARSAVVDIEIARQALVVEWVPTASVVDDLVKAVVCRIDEDMVQRSTTSDRVDSLHWEGAALEALYTLLTQYQYEGKAYSTVRWMRRHLGMAEEETTVLQQALANHTHTTFVDIVDDLLEVIRVLGYREIVCVVDNITVRNLPYLQTWLDERVMQARRGLRVVVVLPTELYRQLRETSRWSVLRLEWTMEEIRTITRTALSLGLQEETFIPAIVFDAAESLFAGELGMTPYAANALAEALYWWMKRHPQLPPDMEVLKTMIYLRRIPLRVDALSGDLNRRLLRLPPLTGIPRTIFNLLYLHRGSWVDKEELLEEVGSAANLHAVIRRIRKIIEPDLKGRNEPIYLHTRHGEGYKLDNIEE